MPIVSRLSRSLVTLTLLTSFSAVAQLTPVPIGSAANSNLRTYTGGSNYPVAPATLVIGGVPFDLTPHPGSSNSLGVMQNPTGNSQLSLFTSVPNAARVYALINSAWGRLDAINGRIEFVGTNGAFASFNLVQGQTIRDHWTAYNQVITNPTIVTMSWPSGVRFDRQTFELPPAFHTETLTEIRLVGTNAGQPQGAAFLAGVTVEAVIPPCDPDVNCDGSADQDDVVCLIDAIGGNLDCICTSLDFNNDGNADQDDVTALISVVAGGDCP
ncbi:MAG: hypothetical protein IT433_03700 [Phycisphaerales bacterium]|nr:hypothetical protein [Phycisphaerales bacterium]